jgi:hypothetical protein
MPPVTEPWLAPSGAQVFPLIDLGAFLGALGTALAREHRKLVLVEREAQAV